MKKTFLITLLAAFLALTLLFFLNQRRLTSIALNKLAGETIKHNVALQFKNPSLALLGLNIEDLLISTRVRHLVANLPLKNVQVRIPLSTLWGKVSQLNLKTELFAGELGLELSEIQPTTQAATLAIDLKNIELNQIELVQLLGLNSGKISFKTDNLQLAQRTARGSFNLKLAELSKSTPTRFPAMLTGLPLDFELPAIENLNLDSDIRISPIELELLKLSLSSNLITIYEVEGKTRFQANSLRPRPESLAYQGVFSLSPAGLEFFGPYLSLFGFKAEADRKIKFRTAHSFTARNAPEIKFEY